MTPRERVRSRAVGSLAAARAAIDLAMRDVALVTETDRTQDGLDARDAIVAVQTGLADLAVYVGRMPPAPVLPSVETDG